MNIAMHSEIFVEDNVLESINLAKEAGFDGLEIFIPRLLKDIQDGADLAKIRSALSGMQVPMLGALLGIESVERKKEVELTKLLKHTCLLSEWFDCNVIQVVALNALDGCRRAERIKKIASSISILAEIAGSKNIRLALEPVCFSSFSSLQDAVEVVMAVGCDKAGLVLDTWHLWVNGTQPEDIIALEPHIILNAHLADSKPRIGKWWTNDDRHALPGEGVVPLEEYVNAIKTTGYNGWWTVEVHGRENFKHWTSRQLASLMYKRALDVLKKL